MPTTLLPTDVWTGVEGGFQANNFEHFWGGSTIDIMGSVHVEIPFFLWTDTTQNITFPQLRSWAANKAAIEALTL